MGAVSAPAGYGAARIKKYVSNWLSITINSIIITVVWCENTGLCDAPSAASDVV